MAYAFHQADVARGILHEERLDAPAAADAARTLPFRLCIALRWDSVRRSLCRTQLRPAASQLPTRRGPVSPPQLLRPIATSSPLPLHPPEMVRRRLRIGHTPCESGMSLEGCVLAEMGLGRSETWPRTDCSS